MKDGSSFKHVLINIFYNIVISFIFLAAMLIVAVVSVNLIIYISMITTLSTGMYSMGDAVSAMVMTYAAIAGVAGMVLFFAFKVENVLIASLRDRIRHIEPICGMAKGKVDTKDGK